MRATEINHIISSPEKTGELPAEELRVLVEQFPYFQAAHVLFAKKMHAEGHIDSHAQIRRAAITAPSGKRLYALLFKEKLIELIENELTELENDDVVSGEAPEAAFEKPLPFKSSTHREHPAVRSREEEVRSEPEPTGEPDKGREEKDTYHHAEKNTPFDLEEEILKHAARSAYQLPDRGEKAGKEHAAADKGGSDRENEKPKPREKRESPKSQGFSDWLRMLDSERFNEMRKKERKKDAEQIIDEFIDKQPQISKADEYEVYNPGNIDKMSIVEDSEFVSETLAKIYTEQGNLSKAKKIYNKLMLKYPEKKAYFARQIDSLEKKEK